MKTIYAFLAVVLLSVAVMAALDPYGKELTRSTTAHPQLTGIDGSATFYWKYWASPTLWKPIDTTSSFFLAEMIPGDTSLTYAVFSGSAKEYRATIYIQGAKNNNWKPTGVLLDTIARAGGDGTVKTAYDSVVVGRPLWHIIKSPALAGCDQFRFRIVKDTGATDQAGGTFGVAALFALNPKR